MLKKIISLLLCVFAIVLTACSKNGSENLNTSSFTIKDDTGYVTAFEKKPERILTFSMGLDGIVLGILPPEKMVAVSAMHHDENSSNITPIAKKIPRTVLKIASEEVMALKPDVVFIYDWGRSNEADALRAIGVKVVVCKGPRNIAEIKRNIELIAKTLQEEAKGIELIGKMDAKLAQLKEQLGRIPLKKKKKVALVSIMQSYGGTGCTYDDICKHANVINGIADVGLKNGQPLTKEMLVKMNPDVFLLPSHRFNGFDLDKFNREYFEDPALQSIAAVQKKQFFNPRDAYIYASSQDVVFGVQEVARAAYGEEFAQGPNSHLSVVEE
ncbi:MAG: ABC transporter substrate-binding protein [Phascolarctobacterium sp.]|nr:ABC transporter substrate-binding protein [Phascolarctobacterium sp.]